MKVLSTLEIVIKYLLAPHVTGVLGKALGDLINGMLVGKSCVGQLNSFQGIFLWSQQKKPLSMRYIFHRDKAVSRKVSNHEIGWIFDYPMN